MIKPLRDLICVRPIEYQHAFLYVAGIRLRKGTVIAVGPGRRMRRKLPYRKNPERADEVTWFEDGPEVGVIRPMRVKVGDVIEFGWRSGVEFEFQGETLLVIPEQSAYWLSDSRADVGILEPQSMSVDAA